MRGRSSAGDGPGPAKWAMDAYGGRITCRRGPRQSVPDIGWRDMGMHQSLGLRAGLGSCWVLLHVGMRYMKLRESIDAFGREGESREAYWQC